MQIIDITMELSERTPVYQTDPRTSMAPHATIEKDGYAVTRLSMGSHSGTHLDAPRHMLPGGKTAVDVPLEFLIGKCYVADVDDFKIPQSVKRILIKGNTGRDNTLNVRQAEALLNAGVRVLGTDGMSIGDDDVHRLLLESDCIILECLELSRVEPGVYVLCALPLKVDCDGAPLRACLMPARR